MRALAAVPVGDRASTQQNRMQFDCMNFQQHLKTLQFQRHEFKI